MFMVWVWVGSLIYLTLSSGCVISTSDVCQKLGLGLAVSEFYIGSLFICTGGAGRGCYDREPK